MDNLKLTISNVKISCKLQLPNDKNLSFNTDKKSVIKFYPNFCVIKSQYTFVIFIKPNIENYFHVNITKIPNIQQINDAISNLINIINEKCIIKKNA